LASTLLKTKAAEGAGGEAPSAGVGLLLHPEIKRSIIRKLRTGRNKKRANHLIPSINIGPFFDILRVLPD
jgi:hypothetical protein